jgi:Flp pilus assembly protein TadD
MNPYRRNKVPLFELPTPKLQPVSRRHAKLRRTSPRILAVLFVAFLMGSSTLSEGETAIISFTNGNSNNVEAIEDRGPLSHENPENNTLPENAMKTLSPLELGKIAFNMGELDNAITNFAEAIRRSPNDPVAYDYRGFAFFRKRDFDKALLDFNQVLELRPSSAVAHNQRGVTYMKKGEMERALADFTTAIHIAPNDGVNFTYRGFGYEKEAQWSRATNDFITALRLDPTDSKALNEYAWLLATCPESKIRNGNTAIKLANEACQLTKSEVWLYVDTLAAACAEAGQFDVAIRCQKQSMTIPGVSDSARQEAQKRLLLYEQHEPYRDVRNLKGPTQ